MTKLTTQEKIARIDKRLDKLKKELHKEQSEKTILCVCCKAHHRICDLPLIQTHWYVEPHGCTGGDYWKEDEIQFICPTSSRINRLLFEIPYDYTTHSYPKVINSYFKNLFKSIEDRYDKYTSASALNNYYVDKNRAKFNLPEKGKQ